jgi:hypothetical protein
MKTPHGYECGCSECLEYEGPPADIAGDKDASAGWAEERAEADYWEVPAKENTK